MSSDNGLAHSLLNMILGACEDGSRKGFANALRIYLVSEHITVKLLTGVEVFDERYPMLHDIALFGRTA